jgi:hypothetical protein
MSYTLKRRSTELYELELGNLLGEQAGEFPDGLIVDRVTDRLLTMLTELAPDVVRDELRPIVGGWCGDYERRRGARTYAEGQLFPMPDHIFVLGEGVRVFARDTTERHLAARTRVVAQNLQRQTAAATAELEQLDACRSALADAAPGATLADVGALAEAGEA